MTVVFSLAGVAPVRLSKHSTVASKCWRRAALIAGLLVLSAGGITTTARPRIAESLKFEIKVVDSVTGKPKSRYFLGETISVVFTLTNQGRRVLTIPELQDTSIPWELVSMFENENTDTSTGYRGGTGGSYVTPDGTVYWTQREARKITLAPGESVSVRIDDLRGRYSYRLEDGSHKLTATYSERLKATVSFRVAVDEAKSIPLLKKIAAAPASNANEGDRKWASSYLAELRQPSLSGLVTDAAGKPLQDVRIAVTGPENSAYETRWNGRYYVSRLVQGRTYTLTPTLRRAGSFDADFTFEPPSRTITNLNSKLTGLNFKATRVRANMNVADRFEGATARASSTLSAPDDKFEPLNVIDGTRSGPWDRCCNAAWNDDTPNAYPDWVEITFASLTAIDWINVFTLQDNPGTTPDPTPNETFKKNGITDFDVQYWSGRAWKNVPGGSVRGNRNVWRKIAFPPITTNKIRVVVRKALGGYSKIMEIEAFHINELPVAKLTGRSKGTTGSTFQFQAHATDRDQAIRKYIVGFGDDTPNYELEYGNKPAVKELKLTHTHTYAAAGTYNVTLKVMDHDDEGSETTMTVTVTDPLKPRFADVAGGYHGVAGKAVFFDGRASSVPELSTARYYWDFGDGKRGTGSTASHKYAAPGTYTVMLLVAGDDGSRERYAALVVIAAVPASLQ